jgi:hypothetical protein
MTANYIAKTHTLFLAFSRAAQCHSMVVCHAIRSRGCSTFIPSPTRDIKNGKIGISRPILGAPWVQMVPRVLQTHASDDRLAEPSS